jgi:putative flippase GtrA
MVGFLNTAISLIVYYIFITIDKSYYITGWSVGFVSSVLNAYYWNSRYVFNKSKKRGYRQILRTFVSYGVIAFLGLILLYLLVDVLSISRYLAPLLILLITVPLNFTINKYWTFQQKLFRE